MSTFEFTHAFSPRVEGVQTARITNDTGAPLTGRYSLIVGGTSHDSSEHFVLTNTRTGQRLYLSAVYTNQPHFDGGDVIEVGGGLPPTLNGRSTPRASGVVESGEVPALLPGENVIRVVAEGHGLFATSLSFTAEGGD